MVIINKRRMTNVFICEYCGNFTTRKHKNQKYCDKKLRPCSKYARMEYKNDWYKKNIKNREVLGTSKIRGHANSDFSKELQVVSKEKSRIKPINWIEYNKKIKEYQTIK